MPAGAGSVFPCVLAVTRTAFFSFQVEWRLFSLRLLSETASLLVSQEAGDGGKEADVDVNGSLLALIRDGLLPQ